METLHQMMQHPVVCVSHCEQQIFSLKVPENCPLCGRGLGGELGGAPVSLKPPLSNGHTTQCCLLITTTHNNSDFEGTSELHTGISNTTGLVYNYTLSGVRCEDRGWEVCVSVPLLGPHMFHLQHQWDHYLQRYCMSPLWDAARFHEEDHNCLSFCLSFLNAVLSLEEVDSAPLNKDVFTQTFVLPRMSRLSRYVRLWNHVSTQGTYVRDRRKGGGGAHSDQSQCSDDQV